MDEAGVSKLWDRENKKPTRGCIAPDRHLTSSNLLHLRQSDCLTFLLSNVAFLQTHLQTHHRVMSAYEPSHVDEMPPGSKEAQKLECVWCTDLFETQGALEAHLSTNHPGPVQFSPNEVPKPITIAERIATLKSLLDDDAWAPTYKNVKAVIEAYERGEVPASGKVFFQDGKRFEDMPAPKAGTNIWVEERGAYHHQGMNIRGREPQGTI
ncbi:hypothetical protein F4861DRAFT_375304 [Xylaria intraflava]|nr:hypothetical protein F4861DRAFT_375304 [Xylaria intraflava]